MFLRKLNLVHSEPTKKQSCFLLCSHHLTHLKIVMMSASQNKLQSAALAARTVRPLALGSPLRVPSVLTAPGAPLKAPRAAAMAASSGILTPSFAEEEAAMEAMIASTGPYAEPANTRRSAIAAGLHTRAANEYSAAAADVDNAAASNTLVQERVEAHSQQRGSSFSSSKPPNSSS
jgi:hypothetical protein